MIRINIKKGFTIPELLVAVVMFSLVTGAAVNLLFAAINAQKSSLIGQNMTSQSSFTMEYMVRAIRQAQKELENSGGCLNAGKGYNYETTDTGDGGIRFINSQGDCQQFYLENGFIWEKIDNKSSDAITSDDFTVTEFSFQLAGEYQADLIQPRVTIMMALENPEAGQFDLRLQTSISQRNIDVVK